MVPVVMVLMWLVAVFVKLGKEFFASLVFSGWCACSLVSVNMSPEDSIMCPSLLTCVIAPACVCVCVCVCASEQTGLDGREVVACLYMVYIDAYNIYHLLMVYFSL